MTDDARDKLYLATVKVNLKLSFNINLFVHITVLFIRVIKFTSMITKPFLILSKCF